MYSLIKFGEPEQVFSDRLCYSPSLHHLRRTKALSPNHLLVVLNTGKNNLCFTASRIKRVLYRCRCLRRRALWC